MKTCVICSKELPDEASRYCSFICAKKDNAFLKLDLIKSKPKKKVSQFKMYCKRCKIIVDESNTKISDKIFKDTGSKYDLCDDCITEIWITPRKNTQPNKNKSKQELRELKQKSLEIKRDKINKILNKGGSCCNILITHRELLKYDPERLSTEFIKALSGCGCKHD